MTARRLFDVTAAASGLVLAALPLALAALAVRLAIGRPVIYRQVRVGRFGAPFLLYKLRTMSGAGGPLVTTDGDARVGRIGRILRRSKLDEVPQLWNVLKGEMSIIGPRPEVPRFVAHYTRAERAILDVTPGLASLAQLVYPHEAALLRDRADPEDAYVRELMPLKIQVDLDYERRRTVWSDCRLLLEVALLVLGKSFRIDPVRTPRPV
ncbi:MAG TPA: sugar transferase [Vicinamibacterales bacterium]|nr:sugar transferase [Vicinamibacterales bacterium]